MQNNFNFYNASNLYSDNFSMQLIYELQKSIPNIQTLHIFQFSVYNT